MSDPAGREIEGYRIDAEIGRGGRAVVHRATQLARQRTVALKVLPADARTRARIVREVTAAAVIDHPHVLPVFEAGEDGERAFIAMKLVDGPSLGELIRAPGGIEARRALAILRQVAEALDHVAARGRAHGDVRPGNVLIGPGDHAYLSGAGLWAADPDGDAGQLAPEGVRGAAADRYALAAVAMEALTGAAVFARADRAATREAHLRREPPAASGATPPSARRWTPCSRAGWRRTRRPATRRPPRSSPTWRTPSSRRRAPPPPGRPRSPRPPVRAPRRHRLPHRRLPRHRHPRPVPPGHRHPRWCRRRRPPQGRRAGACPPSCCGVWRRSPW